MLDNDESILEVMQEALTYEGFEVKCIQESDHILDTIRQFKPDLLITDYLLNGINGGEICHMLKTNNETTSVPVMIISAYPRVLKSLGDYGSDDFIAKPFDLNELMWRIKKLIYKPINNQVYAI